LPLQEKNPDKKTEMIWAKDPANYKWGLWYCNKNDKRFWIKNWNGDYRGKGWIINLARPYATLVFIGIIVFFIIIIFLWMLVESHIGLL